MSIPYRPGNFILYECLVAEHLLAVWIFSGLAPISVWQNIRSDHFFFHLLSLFGGSFFKFDWSVLVPVLFIVGGIYIIFREYFFADDTNGKENRRKL